MFKSKILQLIDKNPDNFTDWACPTYCSKAVCCCKNTNPVIRYMSYKLY